MLVIKWKLRLVISYYTLVIRHHKILQNYTKTDKKNTHTHKLVPSFLLELGTYLLKHIPQVLELGIYYAYFRT